MKKPFLLSILVIAVSLFLGACGDQTTTKTEVGEKTLKYEIVVDKKSEKMEQREIRLTTEETDYDSITKEIKQKYKDQNLDSLHLYIHIPDSNNTFGLLKAHSFVAYTNKGAGQVGLAKSDSYKIEIEKETPTKEANSQKKDDHTSKEWQDSFKQISLSQAQTYVELTEKNGDLPADRLEEYSKVVKQQVNNIIDKTVKDKLIKLSDLIKDNKIKEVKVLINEMN